MQFMFTCNTMHKTGQVVLHNCTCVIKCSQLLTTQLHRLLCNKTKLRDKTSQLQKVFKILQIMLIVARTLHKEIWSSKTFIIFIIKGVFLGRATAHRMLGGTPGCLRALSTHRGIVLAIALIIFIVLATTLIQSGT